MIANFIILPYTFKADICNVVCWNRTNLTPLNGSVLNQNTNTTIDLIISAKTVSSIQIKDLLTIAVISLKDTSIT